MHGLPVEPARFIGLPTKGPRIEHPGYISWYQLFWNMGGVWEGTACRKSVDSGGRGVALFQVSS